MKPTTLLFSLLSAIGVSAISALPSFAQTTSIPFTGAVSVSVFASGGYAVTYLSVLSSLGTISVTDGQITGVSPVTVAGPNISVGDVVAVTGTSTGSIGFFAGGNANFFNVPTNLTLTAKTVSGVIPYIGPVNTNQNFSADFSGFVVIPNSSITSAIGGTASSANSPISRLISVNEESARRIFNAQPVLESGNNFLPPSRLSSSRIHPDLFAK